MRGVGEGALERRQGVSGISARESEEEEGVAAQKAHGLQGGAPGEPGSQEVHQGLVVPGGARSARQEEQGCTRAFFARPLRAGKGSAEARGGLFDRRHQTLGVEGGSEASAWGRSSRGFEAYGLGVKRGLEMPPRGFQGEGAHRGTLASEEPGEVLREGPAQGAPAVHGMHGGGALGERVEEGGGAWVAREPSGQAAQGRCGLWSRCGPTPPAPGLGPFSALHLHREELRRGRRGPAGEGAEGGREAAEEQGPRHSHSMVAGGLEEMS